MKNNIILKITVMGLFLCAFFFLSHEASAQKTYELSGTIIDQEKQEAVPFAQVALYTPEGDTPVTGAVTEEDGRFVFEVEPGMYRLEVAFVGYEEKKLEDIRIRKRDKKLGEILLKSEAQQLDAVVVEGEREARQIETDLEGVTINPDQTLTNAGGSVLDILRNTPSVSVGEDGGVSIRGSDGTNILIDGRNSALASDLEQIPASAIESIKIVNNPNARYDAQAAGGIINIQLKRGEEMGTNGAAEVTVGTRARLNSSARLNHRTFRYNVYGGYSYRSWPRVGSSTTIRETYDDNQRMEQFSEGESSDMEHTFTYGGDYYFGKNILSYEGAFNTEKEAGLENIRVGIEDLSSGNLVDQYFRANNESEDNKSFDNAIIYERTFDNPDREFRALVSHSLRDQVEVQDISVYSGMRTPEGAAPTGLEQSLTDEMRQTSIIQSDYVHPLSRGKIEAGYKTTLRALDNDFAYEIYNESSGTWVNQENVSNRFEYKDQVHAAYLIYSRSFLQNLDVAMGARLEQTFIESRLHDTNEQNEQQYLNLFPSLQAKYDLDEKNALKFTYSRRIDRPSARRLNPFPDVSDPRNIRTGNPDLQPEMINSFELGHLFSAQNTDLTTNLFYRRVNGELDYVVRVEDGISYRRPENLNSSVTYGLEIINTSRLFPWWELNASSSVFRAEVDGTNLGSEFTNSGFSYFAKLTSSLQLPYDLGFQLTGNYTAPKIEAQGRNLARYYIDLSLNRNFFNDRFSAALTLRDVFNTRRFAGENYSTEFLQTFSRKRESRIVLLNLKYNFKLN